MRLFKKNKNLIFSVLSLCAFSASPAIYAFNSQNLNSLLFAQSGRGGTGVNTSPTGVGGPRVTPTTPSQTDSQINSNSGGKTQTVPKPGSYQIEGAIKNPDGTPKTNNRDPLPSQGIPPTDSSRIKNDRSTIPTQGIPPTEPPGRITNNPSLQN